MTNKPLTRESFMYAMRSICRDGTITLPNEYCLKKCNWRHDCFKDDLAHKLFLQKITDTEESISGLLNFTKETKAGD